MVIKIIQGIPITDESIAYDVIKEVEPGEEHITHKHTFQNMRQQFQVDLCNRKTRDAWLNSGSRDIVDLAYEKVRCANTQHQVPSTCFFI